jgi:ADP-heptose:LPS heptosyltransferase
MPRETTSKASKRGGGRWALVHPGATAASRRYPPELFARAVRLLVREHGCPVVLAGGPDEVPLVEEIRAAAGVPSRSLAGRLDLAELAAVIARAPVLVANNSAPAHLAAGLGTPVVDLYALTNPQHTPWMVPARVLFHDVGCKFCYKSVCPQGHHDCLARVPPAAVAAAAAELLEESAGGRRAGAARQTTPLPLLFIPSQARP